MKFRYNFPPVRFCVVDSAIQAAHVKSEADEFYAAKPGSDHEKEEAMDLYHSLETLFRIWEREGTDITALRQKVIDKNTDRGYYDSEI